MSAGRLLVVVSVLALVPLVLYGDVVFGGQSFALRDHQILTIPAHDFIRRSLLGGALPEWWEPATLGFPFASNPAMQGLSPLAWFFSLLPQPFGADVEPVFYVAVLGIGTALFAMRLGAKGVLGPVLSGALAECSGYVASLVSNGAMPYVAWAPWVAWAADRLARSAEGSARVRAAVAFAVIVAVQIVGGEPGSVVTSGLLAIAVVAVRSGSRRYAILGWAVVAGAAGALLSAFSAVPAFEFGRESERAGGLPIEDAVIWSLHPLRLLEFVWPHVLGDPVSRLQYLPVVGTSAGRDVSLGPTWSHSVFVGIPALFLALRGGASRREWPLLGCAALFVGLALGGYTPLFTAFRFLFPPERYLRYPEKHVIGAFVIVWAFAGVGIGRMVAARRAVWSLLGAAAVFAVVLGSAALSLDGLAVTAAHYVAGGGSFLGDAPGALRHAMAAGGLAAIALVAAALGVHLTTSRPWLGRTIVAVVAVVACVADTRSLTVTIPRHHAPPVAAALLPPGTRIYRNPETPWTSGTAESYAEAAYATLEGEIASQFGISSLPGYWLPLTSDLKYFWNEVLPLLPPKVWARAFGISWAMLSDTTPEWGLSSHVVATFADHPLAKIPDVRPRAFVTSGWLSVPDARSALDGLAAGDRDLRLVAVENAPPAPTRAVEAIPCDADLSRGNRADIVCDSPGGGYAVLLDQFAPGWTATVDGVQTEVARADGLFRAVPVTPGRHRIVFEYRTPGLLFGAIVSACAAVALGVALYVSRSRRSGSAAATSRVA